MSRGNTCMHKKPVIDESGSAEFPFLDPCSPETSNGAVSKTDYVSTASSGSRAGIRSRVSLSECLLHSH